MGIRARLLILILSVAVPLAVVGVYGLLGVWEASRAQLNESVKQQSELAAIAFDRWIEAQHQPVTTIAAVVSAKNNNIADVEEFLKFAVLTRTQWIDARVVDAEGKSLIAYPANVEPPPRALVDYLLSETKLLNTWKVITDRTQDESQPVFALAAPVANGGAVIARVDGKFVSELFREIELSSHTVIAVFDEQNRLLYRRQTSDAPIDPNISTASLLAALGESRSSVIERESPFDGIHRVYGLARTGQSDKVVAVGIPSETLYKPARQQLIRYVVFSLLALLFAIAATLFIERSIVRPIQNLRNAARDLGEGNLSARAPLSIGGEIGETGAVFNAMAQQISEREERLKELDRLKSEFVSGVSHELRTPLTTIKTLAHVLQRGNISQGEQQEYLETISSECDRQINLILNLLDLSRIESGNFKVNLAETDVREVVEACIKLEKHAAKDREQILTVQMQKELPLVSTDKNALQRVLCSLVENAIKYTPEGGSVLVEVQLLDGEVAIKVKDTGCGVLEEDLPHIFEKFYRGRPAVNSDKNAALNDVIQTNDAPGVGLGLYLSHSIVEQLGGRITAENNVKRGTVITVYLPALNEKEENVSIEEKINVEAFAGS